ncbi:MAG: nicotinate-nucleotide adenylyltransferase [Caryophanon sp.]|nr:nicotinate-nucleotide adenylyltransferase [Caryophanon sp.]
MKKVGILGGTFNPPHLGHLLMANEAMHALSLDEVRFMPNAIPPHKHVAYMPHDAQRVDMLRHLIDDEPRFSIEQYELEIGGTSYTIDTMRALVAREQTTQFYFIIGGDSIDTLHTWKCIDELTQLVTFVGILRPGSTGESVYPVVRLQTPQIDVSSTLLRARLAQQQTVKYLLPAPLEAYIRKERLYGTH